ncbi:MAG: aminotransferase class I/II-fold pyridoxal phosphate-dependent enzyme, partial [Pseudomonadota bacterium]
LRVGFALGNRELIEALERVKDSFNSYPLDVVAQRAAVAALRDPDWYAHSAARVVASRERLASSLEDLGFQVVPSAANFLFLCHPERSGKELFAALRERGILVRRWDKPRIENYLRISIGTDQDIDRVVEVLDEILAVSA